MRNTKSKQIVKSKLSEESSLNAFPIDFERDDDDPLSIRSLSITFLGLTIAIMTILLPSITILLGRPLSHGNEIIFNHSIKKDGS